MKSGLKVIAINALVLFVLINGIIWTICIGNSIKDSFISLGYEGDSRSKVPNYANADWARTHFAEFDSMGWKYLSYMAWRRRAYSGKTVNISGPYLQRRTVGRSDPEKPTVYFFGGSTMWGVGSDDASAIPSLFAQMSGFSAENFAESGYTSHQSLVLLIQLLQDGHRPDVVVFYDGVNDVIHKCRVELTPWSHSREAKLSSALVKKTKPMSLAYLYEPLKALAEKVAIEFRGHQNGHRNCDNDAGKAEKIADNLVQDWVMAKELVESHGGKFFGVLQPVAFFSDTKLDHLVALNNFSFKYFNDRSIKKQYEVVYPVIDKKIKKNDAFYNFVDSLDRDEYIYIDFCHLSPNGNRYIAEKMVQIITSNRARAVNNAGID